MWVCVSCRLAGRQPLAVGGRAVGADLRLWLCGASVAMAAVAHATWQGVSTAVVGMERPMAMVVMEAVSMEARFRCFGSVCFGDAECNLTT